MKTHLLKYKLMSILAEHVGKVNAIGMDELYSRLYGNRPQSKINGTRRLRKLIESARKEGVPICATTDKDTGGYYLAAAGEELDEYCSRLRKRALKLLALEARLRKTTLPKLLGQISINMEGIDGEGNSQGDRREA